MSVFEDLVPSTFTFTTYALKIGIGEPKEFVGDLPLEFKRSMLSSQIGLAGYSRRPEVIELRKELHRIESMIDLRNQLRRVNLIGDGDRDETGYE